MSQNVTLKDIARKTNLSVGAVSKALAGYPQVSQDTRRRVQEASEQLNYQPKSRATHKYVRRNAAGRRGRPIAEARINLILTEHWGARSAQWMPALAKASQRVGLRLEISFIEMGESTSSHTRNRPSVVAAASSNSNSTAPAEQAESWDKAVNQHAQDVQGLLLFGCFDQMHLQSLAKLNIPTVVMGDVTLPRTNHNLPVHLVSVDKVAMGQLATQTLINQGHTRIGFFCGIHPVGGWNHQWVSGYRLALMQAKLPIDPALQCISDCKDPVEISQSAIQSYAKLKEPPTAYITPSIDVAARFQDIHARQGTPIKPGQFVVGGHIDDACAQGLQDHLILDEPVETMAIHALDLLARLIEDDSLPKAEISVPFTTHHLPE